MLASDPSNTFLKIPSSLGCLATHPVANHNPKTPHAKLRCLASHPLPRRTSSLRHFPTIICIQTICARACNTACLVFPSLNSISDFVVLVIFWLTAHHIWAKIMTLFPVWQFRFFSRPIRSQQNPTWPTFFPFLHQSATRGQKLHLITWYYSRVWIFFEIYWVGTLCPPRQAQKLTKSPGKIGLSSLDGRKN